MRDIAIIARDCFEAYVRKDRAAIEQLIDETFYFTSPIDNRIDRNTYFKRCWPNSEHILKFEFIHIVPHGDQVFVTYEGLAITEKVFAILKFSQYVRKKL